MKLAEMVKLEIPEGATHFVLDDDGFSAAWYKRDGVLLYGMAMSNTGDDRRWSETKGVTRSLRDLKTDAELMFERQRQGK